VYIKNETDYNNSCRGRLMHIDRELITMEIERVDKLISYNMISLGKDWDKIAKLHKEKAELEKILEESVE
jgi:hypothetical protein